MDVFHVLLIICWVFYYALHSVLASFTIKRAFERWLGRRYRYYRLAYTIIAAVGLVAILIYQYSIDTTILWEPRAVTYLAGGILAVTGIIIMAICVKKYFYQLSGVQSVCEADPTGALRTDGIHQRMRHPLYAGTLLFVWGLFFVFPFINNLIAVILLTTYVYIGIILEERKLVLIYGEQYKSYRRHVPMLIPRLKA